VNHKPTSGPKWKRRITRSSERIWRQRRSSVQVQGFHGVLGKASRGWRLDGKNQFRMDSSTCKHVGFGSIAPLSQSQHEAGAMEPRLSFTAPSKFKTRSGNNRHCRRSLGRHDCEVFCAFAYGLQYSPLYRLAWQYIAPTVDWRKAEFVLEFSCAKRRNWALDTGVGCWQKPRSTDTQAAGESLRHFCSGACGTSVITGCQLGRDEIERLRKAVSPNSHNLVNNLNSHEHINYL
jgi:hypothetical protein